MNPALMLALFVLGSAALAFVSRRSLLRPRAHGFYRFFAWDALWGMFLRNAAGWFRDPLRWNQVVSWALLAVSLALVIAGIRLLRRGGQAVQRGDPALLGMERTSRLVTGGLYRHIRHPLYSSLLFLAWGMFFKSPSWPDGGLALLVSLLLAATARVEEGENLRYFGTEYAAYMRASKRFIPFLY